MVKGMLAELEQVRGPSGPEVMEKIPKSAKQVEALEGAIVDFLGRLRQGTLTHDESKTHISLMAATTHLREISDIVSDELLDVARAAAERPSPRLEPAAVSEFYGRVQRAVEMAVTAVRHSDIQAAQKALAMSGEIRQFAEGLLATVAEGFSAGDPEGPARLRLQTTFVNGVRQIFTLAKRLARSGYAPEHEVSDAKTPA
jgi:phosphate:Na+ symporter